MSRPPQPSRPGCAVITGGTRGIGAAIAASLAGEGWPVGLIHRIDEESAAATEQTIEAKGGRAMAMRADVRDAELLERKLSELQDALGPALVLVNNAGVRPVSELAAALDDDRVREALDVNLACLFRVTRLVLRPMLRTRWGRVINIASVAGLTGVPGESAYAAAKAGVLSYTRTLAVEVARRGMTVNAVAPGLIDTEMTADVDPELRGAVPARRQGTPEEVSACVQFLVSAGAAYVTGATLVVDGGLTAGFDPTRFRGVVS